MKDDGEEPVQEGGGPMAAPAPGGGERLGAKLGPGNLEGLVDTSTSLEPGQPFPKAVTFHLRTIAQG